MKPLLITTANLHTGGGVAVATSVLHEIAYLPTRAREVSVLASSEVDANLRTMGTPFDNFHAYRVLDTFGLEAGRTKLPVNPTDYRAVLGIFGPLYWRNLGHPSVVGFAQPWVAYPKNEAYDLLTPWARARSKVKYQLVAGAFSRSDCLIVEQEHVRRALRRRALFRSTRIEVVPNVVDALHFDESRWAPLDMPPTGRGLRLGIVSRNYPHKNLEIIPSVLRTLRTVHGLEAEFWVTFSDEEYAATPAEFRAAVNTVGSLALNQAPTFYRGLDGVVFPSLLECFSATPIEALAARVPLFASDRAFVRETVGDHASYFDPLDPGDIAHAIARFFHRSPADRERLLTSGFDFVASSTYTSRDRALALLRIADDLAATCSKPDS